MKDIRKCPVCGAFTEDKRHCNANTTLFLDGKRRLMLSKLLSGILRHFPYEVGINMNNEGYVDIDELVHAIKTRWKNKELYKWVTREHIIAIALLDPKGRFEIRNNKIRARYGHSIKHLKIKYTEEVANEVEILYHGTQERFLNKILKEGLKPMKRLKVHLTSSFKDAIENALRKGNKPVILEIDVRRLRKSGYKIYKAGKNVYVTDYVPPSCIRRVISVSSKN